MLSSAFLTIALAVAAFAHPARQLSAKVITSCSVPNTAALTFDDGPWKYSEQIVDTLDARGIKATFFVNGDNYGCIYGDAQAQALKNAYSKGHQIASHTWAHKDLATLSRDEVDSEFTGVDKALESILGVKVAFVRPPFGSYSADVLQVAAEHGQNVIIWDFDSGDGSGVSPARSKSRYDKLVASHPNTILALNHETYVTTATTVLPHAIEELQDAGYELVTVADCLGLSPYLSVGNAGTNDVCL
ncbi:carbohydrate esterase family 4 protein [Guyanagaster necrorhizus]|uniref:Carbohydrate esterase family 4 protein n=1 Tax=Guyanagaster necrorhizus TaxID=856835 RepID=A0A9P8AYZ9_9AGAR|nr:carbohydrate esterase family 4 protein [Guyanagaster necrorhizus MCA 3950]KAG7451447.1 carbohydrate esterase family 4 protein [Guyanagaster necrorhizus MCA 3950]